MASSQRFSSCTALYSSFFPPGNLHTTPLVTLPRLPLPWNKGLGRSVSPLRRMAQIFGRLKGNRLKGNRMRGDWFSMILNGVEWLFHGFNGFVHGFECFFKPRMQKPSNPHTLNGHIEIQWQPPVSAASHLAAIFSRPSSTKELLLPPGAKDVQLIILSKFCHLPLWRQKG